MQQWRIVFALKKRSSDLDFTVKRSTIEIAKLFFAIFSSVNK
jgi:hypothetical protein